MKKEDIKKIDIHQKKNLNQNIRVEEGKMYYSILLNNVWSYVRYHYFLEINNFENKTI